ncbi:Potassium voltage-gated channel protein Shal [Melipona quadrifasciata]|uniref:Potassium voltage-gated channel protein Shal n=1 Tax=Melipona quadrifasciata TaxID=166423 RepID=A0A0M8ZW77_9HYME|nr:Potassium voltage-gated channel protein Shal [Melipona quadrifasciata]
MGFLYYLWSILLKLILVTLETVIRKARLARIRIAKASSGAAFVSKKKAAEARLAAQESGLQLDDNYKEEDIFELQHHHLLRCLEKTTVRVFHKIIKVLKSVHYTNCTNTIVSHYKFQGAKYTKISGKLARTLLPSIMSKLGTRVAINQLAFEMLENSHVLSVIKYTERVFKVLNKYRPVTQYPKTLCFYNSSTRSLLKMVKLHCNLSAVDLTVDFCKWRRYKKRESDDGNDPNKMDLEESDGTQPGLQYKHSHDVDPSDSIGRTVRQSSKTSHGLDHKHHQITPFFGPLEGKGHSESQGIKELTPMRQGISCPQFGTRWSTSSESTVSPT